MSPVFHRPRPYTPWSLHPSLFWIKANLVRLLLLYFIMETSGLYWGVRFGLFVNKHTHFLLKNFFFLFQRCANVEIMLFWELPLLISSACANLRFCSKCSISCPPTPLTAKTFELFCTLADFSWKLADKSLHTTALIWGYLILSGLNNSGSMLWVVFPPITKLKVIQLFFFSSTCFC